jgi:hypothetical protein
LLEAPALRYRFDFNDRSALPLHMQHSLGNMPLY